LNGFEFDWSCETYHRIETLKEFDAIYLGAVGFPGVPDRVSLWGFLLPPLNVDARRVVSRSPVSGVA
jgi:hypothetical protein